MSANPLAQIYAYANSFAAPPRLEVLIDWADEHPWPDREWLEKDVTFHLYLVGGRQPPNLSVDFSPIAGSEIVARPSSFLEPPNAGPVGQEFVASVLKALSRRFEMKGQVPFKYSNFASELLQGPGAVSDFFAKAPNYYFGIEEYLNNRDVRRTVDSKEADPKEKLQALGRIQRLVATNAIRHADRLLSFRDNVAAVEEVRFPESDPVGVLRTIAREEPTVGHLFRVLFYMDVDVSPWWKLSPPLVTDPMNESRLWLVARPHLAGASQPEPLTRFLPVPTRLGLTPVSMHTDISLSRVITVLHKLDDSGDADPARQEPDGNVRGFWAPTVAARVVTGDDLPQGSDSRVLPFGLKDMNEVGSMDTTFLKKRLIQLKDLGLVVSRRTLDEAAREMWRSRNTAGVGTSEGKESDKESRWAEDRVSAAAALQASRPRFDAIGITWTFPDLEKSQYHRGFRGYRIDVQVRGTTGFGPWTSLCRLTRRALGPESWRVLECQDGRAHGELREGHVTLPVQGDPTQQKSEFVVARDYKLWSGSSVVKPYPLDRLGRLDRELAADDPIKLEELIPRDLPMLTYGGGYRFAVRKVGLSGMCARALEPPIWPGVDPDLSRLQ